MTTKETRENKISFPFDLYFKQLFSTDSYVRFINPFSFWRRYKIEHLESCREFSTVQYLERCHQIEWQWSKLLAPQKNKRCPKLPSSEYLSLKQETRNTMFIIRPSIKLKYRGVTYHTPEIIGININNLKIDPSSVEVNDIQQPSNSNNTNTPEISGSN